jgi:hypothetical protein
MQQDQASRQQGRSRRPIQPRQRRLPFQTAVPHKAAGPYGHTARASDNGPLPPGRYGQNERPTALGRKSWLFCGSDRGGQRAAVLYSLIVSAKVNDADPQAWLADVLARIATHSVQQLDQLLPWNWRRERLDAVAA